MPTLTKIDERAFYGRGAPSQRAQIKAQYDQLLAPYAVGELTEVTLDEGEKRTQVKNRLQSAAIRRGLKLRFRRTSDDNKLKFQLVDPTGPTEEDEDEEGNEWDNDEETADEDEAEDMHELSFA
jgi:hypothetical protein